MEPSRPQQPSAATRVPEPAAGRSDPAIRASDQDRDAAVHRVQEAFAEGRLDDGEFDERMRAALTARTGADLDRLVADLPATQPGVPTAAGGDKVPGRLAIAVKGSLRRGGRWRVPARVTSVVYKGSGWLDLRAAELTAPVTKITAVAYKSRIDILVLPGVRVEVRGPGVSSDWPAAEGGERQLARTAPVVQIRGVAYRGAIEAGPTPPAP
jgi:hypothetical protein